MVCSVSTSHARATWPFCEVQGKADNSGMRSYSASAAFLGSAGAFGLKYSPSPNKDPKNGILSGYRAKECRTARSSGFHLSKFAGGRCKARVLCRDAGSRLESSLVTSSLTTSQYSLLSCGRTRSKLMSTRHDADLAHSMPRVVRRSTTKCRWMSSACSQVVIPLLPTHAYTAMRSDCVHANEPDPIGRGRRSSTRRPI